MPVYSNAPPKELKAEVLEMLCVIVLPVEFTVQLVGCMPVPGVLAAVIAVLTIEFASTILPTTVTEAPTTAQELLSDCRAKMGIPSAVA